MSNSIYFVTGNKDKLIEAKKIAEEFPISIIGKSLKLKEVKSLDQREVVKDLAIRAFNIIRKPLFVDDTGIYIEGYNDFPGTYTKFALKTLGIKGLKKLIDEDSRAFWRCLICYINGKRIKLFCGILRGMIRFSEKSFNYNQIFFPNNLTGNLESLDMDKRARVSHRGEALRKLFAYLMKNEI